MTPSPAVVYGPGGKPEAVVPPGEYTDGMRAIVEYARHLAASLLGVALSIKIVREPRIRHGAWFSAERAALTFNLAALGRAWFAAGVTEEVDQLLIHEFGHYYSADHLSSDYHKALCRLGAQLARLALEHPDFFRSFDARALANGRAVGGVDGVS